ncbi:hypothetical protein GCM10007887_34090 [Methylobacterium haplocladii]|uniref:Uncharacterized protein n=1 Tax=Methylobacterium haplocladii TaxID=1176176 RepID=A0A512IVT7_9HYPH|nr:hypothetical protein MHA02_41980 [Methylobacterium haplocladii]GLS60724.1 hypothetical protein GCM10007887_34090 [Methylobacterium haplocladii]
MLRLHGLDSIRDLEPPEPMRRYERDKPGELIHIEKLGRFARTGHRITGDRTRQSSSCGIGWEHLHLAVEECRVAAFGARGRRRSPRRR